MPATLRYPDTDTATVYERGADGKKKRLASLFWGDSVKAIGKSAGDWKLDFTTRVWDVTQKKYIWKKHEAFMDGDVAFRDSPLLKVRFVMSAGATARSSKRRMVTSCSSTAGKRSPFYHKFTSPRVLQVRTLAAIFNRRQYISKDSATNG